MLVWWCLVFALALQSSTIAQDPEAELLNTDQGAPVNRDSRGLRKGSIWHDERFKGSKKGYGSFQNYYFGKGPDNKSKGKKKDPKKDSKKGAKGKSKGKSKSKSSKKGSKCDFPSANPTASYMPSLAPTTSNSGISLPPSIILNVTTASPGPASPSVTPGGPTGSPTVATFSPTVAPGPTAAPSTGSPTTSLFPTVSVFPTSGGGTTNATELRVSVPAFFISYVTPGLSGTPSADDYAGLLASTDDFFTTLLTADYATDNTLTFERLDLSINNTQLNAGIPQARFNVNIDYNATAVFSADSQAPKPLDVLNLMLAADFVQYILTAVRPQPAFKTTNEVIMVEI